MGGTEHATAVLLIALLSVALPGCGDGGGAGDTTGAGDGGTGPGACATAEAPPPAPECSGAEASPISEPVGLADEMFNAVLAQEWEALWGTVGQYACGDAPLYTGSFATPDPTIDTDAAIASLVSGDGLEWVTAISAGPHLIIFMPDIEMRTYLRQQLEMPGTTEMSIIVGYNSSFGVRGSCTDCLVDLTTEPDAIELDLTAIGEYGDGSPLEIRPTGSFVRVPVEEVTFGQIGQVTQLYSAEVLDIMDSFEPCGSELVRYVSRIFVMSAPAPEGSGWADDRCYKSVPFEAIWYVDPQRPGRHGIRDLVLGEPEYCCEELAVGQGPFEKECFDEW